MTSPAEPRRRRAVVALTLAVGCALLGLSLATAPGDTVFYPLLLAVALVWTVGGLASGPVPFRPRPAAGRERMGPARRGRVARGWPVPGGRPGDLRDRAAARLRRGGAGPRAARQRGAGRRADARQRRRRGDLLPRRAIRRGRPTPAAADHDRGVRRRDGRLRQPAAGVRGRADGLAVRLAAAASAAGCSIRCSPTSPGPWSCSPRCRRSSASGPAYEVGVWRTSVPGTVAA